MVKGRYSMVSLRSTSFRRYPEDGYVGGVCAGVALYLDWNVRLIRALAVLSLIFGGGFPVLLIYGLLWYVMEKNGERGRAMEEDEEPGRYRSSRYTETRTSTRTSTSSADLKARFSHLESRLSSMEECVTSNDYELRRELRKLES